jgi:tol-pal system protein YbgF
MFHPLGMSLVLVVSGGCADRGAPLRREIAELKQKLEAAAQEKVEAKAKLDELTNQILILQDRLEQAASASARHPVELAPRPPVIRVQPQPAPEASPEPRGALAAAEESEIEYSGEARDTRSPRPVLRIDGPLARRGVVPPEPQVELPEAQRGVRRARVSVRQPLMAPATTDRLEVVPLPDAGVSSRPATPASPLPTASAAASPATLYARALEALRRRAHAEAITGFEEFLARWPRHELCQNASYWLAEAHYDQADYKRALEEFRRVVQRYPSGSKAPDALLKAGFCQAKLGDMKSARNLLGQVIELYPKSNAAQLASERLRGLR